MISTKDLELAVALTLATAYVEGETPQSTMIVSEYPESGKTMLVNKFRHNDGIAVISDATAKGLLESFKGDLMSGALKHIIIPEFLAPISRNQNTVKSFLSTIQILIEDGYQRIDTGFIHQKYDSPKRIGVIACLPKGEFTANKFKWMQSGLLSRFLVLTYSYSHETVDTILAAIMARQYLEEADITVVFGDAVNVTLPLGIALSCKDLALQTCERARHSKGMYGFRQLESVQRLVMASVVLDKAQGVERDNVATQADFDKIEAISYLFNEEFNELKGFEPEPKNPMALRRGKIQKQGANL